MAKRKNVIKLILIDKRCFFVIENILKHHSLLDKHFNHCIVFDLYLHMSHAILVHLFVRYTITGNNTV
jgi:hypothetical protein